MLWSAWSACQTTRIMHWQYLTLTCQLPKSALHTNTSLLDPFVYYGHFISCGPIDTWIQIILSAKYNTETRAIIPQVARQYLATSYISSNFFSFSSYSSPLRQILGARPGTQIDPGRLNRVLSPGALHQNGRWWEAVRELLFSSCFAFGNSGNKNSRCR